MYEVAVSRSFVAQHYLTVPDAGPEGTLHSHRYAVEARCIGPTLGDHGYLLDVDALDGALEAVVEEFRDRVLNDVPAIEGPNPSTERLATVVADRLLDRLDPIPDPVTALRVTIDEDDVATVGHVRSV